MNSDCAFTIGSTHRICQDYAIIGKKDYPYLSFMPGMEKCWAMLGAMISMVHTTLLNIVLFNLEN